VKSRRLSGCVCDALDNKDDLLQCLMPRTGFPGASLFLPMAFTLVSHAMLRREGLSVLVLAAESTGFSFPIATVRGVAQMVFHGDPKNTGSGTPEPPISYRIDSKVWGNPRGGIFGTPANAALRESDISVAIPPDGHESAES
jgi:hypothetical protein